MVMSVLGWSTPIRAFLSASVSSLSLAASAYRPRPS